MTTQPLQQDLSGAIVNLEKMALVSALLGTGAAIFLQQVSYATIPLSIHAAVLSESHRRRVARNYQRQIDPTDRGVTFQDTLSVALNPSQSTQSTTLEPLASLDRTRLNLTFAKLKEVQQWQREFKLRDWQAMTEQVAQLQAQLDAVNDRMSAMADQIAASAKKPVKPFPLKQVYPLPQVRWAKVPHRPELDRVMIFIDASNLYYAAKKQKIVINYPVLVQLLQGQSRRCQTIVYSSVKSCDPQQVDFLKFLRRQGFLVMSKEVVRRSDGSEKGNLDVELAVDFVKFAEHYDTAILVSGDQDFLYPIHQSHMAGKRVEVVSFSANMSTELIRAC